MKHSSFLFYHFLRNAAVGYAVAEKFTKAREAFLRAQELFREQRDLLSESQVNIYLGLTYLFQEQPSRLLASMRRGLDLANGYHQAQERIKQMIDQLSRSIPREIYEHLWQESNQYYQMLLSSGNEI